MACYVMAPSHYFKKFWLLISGDLWQLLFKVLATSPSDQRVTDTLYNNVFLECFVESYIQHFRNFLYRKLCT